MRKFLGIVVLVLSAPACVPQKDRVPTFAASFTGFNRFGETKTCYTIADTQCNSTAEEARNFLDACRAKNGDFGRCDCDTYLCSVNASETPPNPPK